MGTPRFEEKPSDFQIEGSLEPSVFNPIGNTGMFGKQLVFATPLLKWYLAQGLTVSNVTLVVEYDPSA